MSVSTEETLLGYASLTQFKKRRLLVYKKHLWNPTFSTNSFQGLPSVESPLPKRHPRDSQFTCSSSFNIRGFHQLPHSDLSPESEIGAIHLYPRIGDW